MNHRAGMCPANSVLSVLKLRPILTRAMWMSTPPPEISEKFLKPLKASLPAPASVRTASCLPVSRGPPGRDYETVTQIRDALKRGEMKQV
jgi:hypothetical protein